MNLRTIVTLFSLPFALLACEDSDDVEETVIEPSNEPGVVAIVHERVETLVVDDQRLYWIGSHLPGTDVGNVWFLHSCQKANCASTLVTYDQQPYGVGNVFSVGQGEVRWYRTNLRQLVACPIVGCTQAPLVLASNLSFTAAAFDDNRFYFSELSSIYSLSLSEPGWRQLVASSRGALRAITVDDTHAYWLSVDDESSLSRAAKDGTSDAEIITNDVQYEINYDFSVTTDATSIYWTNNLPTGSIHRCPLTGCTGDSDVIITPLRAPQKLLLDGPELNYTHEPKAYEYALASCTSADCAPSSPVIEQLDAPGALAADDEYLYVATTEQDVSPGNLTENTVAKIRKLAKPYRAAP